MGCHGHGSPLSLIPAIATLVIPISVGDCIACSVIKIRFAAECHYRAGKTTWYRRSWLRYRLGTDLPGEQRGLIPNAKFYDKPYRGSWNGLTVISISVGQEILATPLQIANLGATIANRGISLLRTS